MTLYVLEHLGSYSSPQASFALVIWHTRSILSVFDISSTFYLLLRHSLVTINLSTVINSKPHPCHLSMPGREDYYEAPYTSKKMADGRWLMFIRTVGRWLRAEGGNEG